MASGRLAVVLRRLLSALTENEDLEQREFAVLEEHIRTYVEGGDAADILRAIAAQPLEQRPYWMRSRIRDVLLDLHSSAEGQATLQAECDALLDRYVAEALDALNPEPEDRVSYGGGWALMFLSGAFNKLNIDLERLVEELETLVHAEARRTDSWGGATIDFLCSFAGKEKGKAHAAQFKQLADHVLTLVPEAERKDVTEAHRDFQREVKT